MDILKTVVKNAVVVYAAELTNKSLMFGLFIWIARQLGSVEFGKFSFATVFIAMVGVVADMGLSLLVTRKIAENRALADRYLSGAIVAKLTLFPLLAVFIWLYATLSHFPGDIRTVLILLTLALIFETLSLVYISVLRGFERMEFEGAAKVLQACLKLGLAGAVLFSGGGIIALSGVVLITNALVFLVYAIINWKYRFASLKLSSIHSTFLLGMAREALPYMLLAIFISIYFQVDTIMLQHMRGSYEVGQYSAAYKLLEVVIIASWVFSRVVFPVMSSFFRTSMDSLRKMTHISIKVFIAFGVLIAASTTLLSQEIILFAYGTTYPESITALRILIWAVIPIFISSITISVINSSNRPQVSTYIAGILVLCNIALNLVLIPKYGLSGAAVSTVITESGNVVGHSFYIKRCIFELKFLSYFLRPILSAAVASAVIWLLPKSIFLVLLFVPVYVATLVGIGGLKAIWNPAFSKRLWQPDLIRSGEENTSASGERL